MRFLRPSLPSELLPTFVLASSMLLALAGCPSEDGEVCFTDGDCSGDLVCCGVTSGAGRGRCRAESACAPEADGGPVIDASVDASMMMGTDAGTPCTFFFLDGGVEPMDPCPAGFFCEVATDCGLSGICVPRPMSCDGLLAPVCACDDFTYVNACEANLAGQTVRSVGECTATPFDGGPMVDAGADGGAGDAGVGDAGADDAGADGGG